MCVKRPEYRKNMEQHPHFLEASRTTAEIPRTTWDKDGDS